ncbi:MAG TPA: hypothetical protein VFW45_10795 [Candidatus Polarisedimenticolia bacterium]|nr:hypothetical protein [Candidatus Polarisedimenticolia bacterium]
MKARRCSEVQDELTLARLEGVPLSPAAEDHFRSCRGCGLERVRLEEILGGLGRDPVPDPGEDYWRLFLPRIRERLASEPAFGAHHSPARWWALAATAASFLVAAVTVWGWRAPAEVDAAARLHRLAMTDSEGVQQALDLIAPDPDWAVDERSAAVSMTSHMQDVLEEVFPGDEPGIYESSGEHPVEQQRPVAQGLDRGWV